METPSDVFVDLLLEWLTTFGRLVITSRWCRQAPGATARLEAPTASPCARPKSTSVLEFCRHGPQNDKYFLACRRRTLIAAEPKQRTADQSSEGTTKASSPRLSSRSLLVVPGFSPVAHLGRLCSPCISFLAPKTRQQLRQSLWDPLGGRPSSQERNRVEYPDFCRGAVCARGHPVWIKLPGKAIGGQECLPPYFLVRASMLHIWLALQGRQRPRRHRASLKPAAAPPSAMTWNGMCRLADCDSPFSPRRSSGGAQQSVLNVAADRVSYCSSPNLLVRRPSLESVRPRGADSSQQNVARAKWTLWDRMLDRNLSGSLEACGIESG